MLDIQQFRDLIIRPALALIQLPGPEAAEELLLGTALQESGLRYLKQIGGGPALGLFQMEPASHDDIQLNFVSFRSDLRRRLLAIESSLESDKLVGNLLYSAAMCRIHYYRSPLPLPAVGNIEDQARLWKVAYNTVDGAGTEAEYLEKWHKYVG